MVKAMDYGIAVSEFELQSRYKVYVPTNTLGVNLLGFFNAASTLREEHSWYYLTHGLENKEVHTFQKGIGPKVKALARQELELALLRFCNPVV